MRFKVFLLEQLGSRRALDVYEAIDYLQDKCNDYLSACSREKDLLLFRGEVGSKSAIEIADSRNFIRKSANTQSWYNMWIDSSPVWVKDDYPKRLSSFICSNEFSDSYGTPKIVIPSDSCKIGVCPEPDIWLSFKNSFYKFFGSNPIITSIDDFQFAIKAIWSLVDSQSDKPSGSLPHIRHSGDIGLDIAKIQARSAYSDLKKKLSECTLEKIIKQMEEISGVEIMKGRGKADFAELEAFAQTHAADRYVSSSSSYYTFKITILPVVKAMYKHKIKNLAQVFDEILDPSLNGFKSLKPSEIKNYGSSEKEIWVGGECLFLEPDSLHNSEQKRILVDFFNTKNINLSNYLN
jgi:hypothetical protein